MALSGELKDFGLLQLLTLIQVTKKTGMLTLQRPGETATVYFENGLLARVKKASDAHSAGLAKALHRAGKIDRDQYEAITAQAPTEKAIGLLLEDQAILSRDELAEFMSEMSLSDLFSLLTWTEGVFRLDVDSSLSEDDIVAPTDLTPILEKGRSYLEEWQLLVSSVPDLERPLRLLPEPRLTGEEISLTLPEWRMLATLAANIPLQDVAEKLGLDEFGVRQVAYRLIGAGLAEMGEAELVAMPRIEEPVEAEVARSGGFGLFWQRKK